MGRIISNSIIESLPIKFSVHPAEQADTTSVMEPDFVELHALFEIQYEQFLNDTSDEITKRTQRLMELA